jgi:phosphoglycerate kinase
VAEVVPKTRVILRIDADVPMEDGQILDNSRLKKSIPTIKLLLSKGCKIAILGHRGRPEGKRPELSLKPVYLELMSLIEEKGDLIESVFWEDFSATTQIDKALANNNIVFFENLRFWPGEESNDESLLRPLREISQVFVNDAFAVAHRRHASIMLHQKLPSYFGLSFMEEAEKISQVKKQGRPLTIVLGGAKEDKLKHLPELEEAADTILIGGKLPRLMNSDQLTVKSEKIIVAGLRSDGLDLSNEDIDKFIEVIAKSNTVVWAGAMGWFEKEDYQKGTVEIAKAIAQMSGYKIIAGGDTSASVEKLGVKEKIDFVCSGGGVMLEYLAKGSLAAWE